MKTNKKTLLMTVLVTKNTTNNAIYNSQVLL